MNGTKRQLAFGVALLALGGCTWGRSKPENCVRFAASAGNTRLERLAAAVGAARVTVEHNLCSDKRERLQGFARVMREEVGWCARVEEQIPASAAAAGASVGQWCRHAVDRQVRYAHWTSVIGENLLFVGELDVIENALIPATR